MARKVQIGQAHERPEDFKTIKGRETMNAGPPTARSEKSREV